MPVIAPTSPDSLPAREVYQRLKDVALQLRALRLLAARQWQDEHRNQLLVEVDGWTLTLCLEGATLDYCAACQADDGRQGSLDTWQRQGTNPASWLSRWEQEQVERLLAGAELAR